MRRPRSENTVLYALVDEPVPSRWSQLAVKPLWPLLAMMVGGAWIGFPWFAVNGFALGSPTRYRELALAAIGLVGSVVPAYVAITIAHAMGLPLPRTIATYVGLLIVLYKLGLAYVLHELQGRVSSLHEHFGGRLRNGAPVVFLAAALGRSWLLPKLLANAPIVSILLS